MVNSNTHGLVYLKRVKHQRLPESIHSGFATYLLRIYHRLQKFNCPYNANLMYNRASKPPCTQGILTSADFFWKQFDSPTWRTFCGNLYTAPTPSIHTIQQLGLAISKSYSLLLTNATCQRPPAASIWSILFSGSLGRHISHRYVASCKTLFCALMHDINKTLLGGI